MSGVLDLPKEKTFFKRFRRRLKLIKLSFQVIPHCDIIHFHYHTILPFGLDLLIWKAMNKKIIMHFHGSDIRGKGTQFLKLLLADKIFVSTPDLLKWTRGDAVWLPNPINLDLPELQPVEKEDSPIITIVHAPSDRYIKGTKYLQLAVQSLQLEGYPVRLKIIENQSHEVALKAMQQADIVVDQLLSGYYSMVTIEAWALGKPVICYIDFLLPYISEAPVCSADIANIKDAIRELIKYPETRKMWAEKGREYVKRVHDVKGVVYSYVL
jgi:glycosyltransferase involved in cell wall biosynthesis